MMTIEKILGEPSILKETLVALFVCKLESLDSEQGPERRKPILDGCKKKIMKS